MAANTGTTKNTCEQAFDILAARPDACFRGVTGDIELRRKFPHLAGNSTDGTRIFIIRPCDRIRWLVIDLGWKTLAEIDHRDYWDRPEAMAAAVLDAIEAWGEGRKPKTLPQYREELTPAGPQLVIPGCERQTTTTATAQLSLFA